MRNENENEDIELITLVDDDHVEHTFEIIDALEYEGDSYYALLPVYDDEEDQQCLCRKLIGRINGCHQPLKRCDSGDQ